MTREDIIRMAREAGLTEFGGVTEQNIERFAALVAAAEREACARLCDEICDDPHVVLHVGTICAAAIRARGQE